MIEPPLEHRVPFFFLNGTRVSSCVYGMIVSVIGIIIAIPERLSFLFPAHPCRNKWMLPGRVTLSSSVGNISDVKTRQGRSSVSIADHGLSASSPPFYDPF
jgi:hypothetical protein